MLPFIPDNPHVANVRPSPNFEPRRTSVSPDILLLHYTGMRTAEEAIAWLANPISKVSCHYVVDQHGAITQMVPETMRAWHAGVSSWCGLTDINSASIGIEIHNTGHTADYPDFPPAQMEAVIALAGDIVRRHSIPSTRVLAHSDVAPERKIDPGEKFDWSRLAGAGVGHWATPEPLDAADLGLPPGSRSELAAAAQDLLAAYGYAVDATGELDPRTIIVIAAFQRHFRPARVDGLLDHSTLRTLQRLAGSVGSVSASS